MSGSRNEDDMAAAILGYLAEHPRAMDTLEGIAEWWLMRQQVRIDIITLRRVLRRLTNSGVLEEIGSGTQQLYRRKS